VLAPFDSATLYVVVIIFIATLIRSTLGFGEALVAVPLLALRTPVAIAAPLAVLVSVIVAGVIVVQDWHHVEVRSAARLVVASLAGIPIGLTLLAKADDHVVKSILGLVIVAFSIYSLANRRSMHLSADHAGWLIACGVVSGILGGAYGMNGPPLAIYGSLRRWSPAQFRATLQGYFLPASIAGAAGYAFIGLWNAEITRYFLWSLPGVALALLLGRAINQRIRTSSFFQFIYGGLLVIGTVLLLQGLRTA
jgi:uncharacterized membrane protein YfcA